MTPHPARAIALSAALAATVIGGTWLFQPMPGADPHNRFEAVDTGKLPELRSRNGMLEATLVAAPMLVQIGGVSFPGAGYNGIYGGPVLRLHAGDLLILHLVNHMPDAINLHFHGLRVPPTGHGDNMHIQVQPGTRFDYVLRIPRGHPPGLFWYHDHALEKAEPHVMAGLSGALLIDGFAAAFHGLQDTPQKLLVLKDWIGPGCAGAMLKIELHCRVVSINGAAAWHTEMAPNGSQLWRISNQGANLTLHLAAPGLSLRIIGRDGVPATNFPPAAAVDIMPASRIDVLVQAANAGTFALLATGVPTGAGAAFSIRRNMGAITVTGAKLPAPPPLAFPPMVDLRGQEIGAHRTITFTENASGTSFFVNGRQFLQSRIDLRAPLGSIEEWVIENKTPDFHEFHIHQLGFQLTEINHVKQDFTGTMDDVRVPEFGQVKLLIPFTDPLIAGHIMFHCHVLNHEDRGMMATMEIFQPGLLHICRTPGP
jgi:FtsP/CotA-like multicopper oxidase with cupredoxin domain